MDSYQLLKEYFSQNKSTLLLNLLLIFFNYPLEIIVLSYLSSQLFVKFNDLNKNWNSVITLLLMLIGAYVLLELSISMKDNLDSRHIPKFEEFVRSKIVEQVFKKNEINCDNVKMGGLIQRLMKIPPSVSDVYERCNKYILPFFLTVLTVVVYLFWINTKLGIMGLVCFGLYFAVYSYIARKQIELSQQREKDETRLYEYIEDTLGNIFTIFSHNQLDHEQQQLDRQTKEFRNIFENEMSRSARLKTVVSFMNISMFSVFLFGILYLFRQGEITQATTVALFTMSMFLVKHIRGLARRVTEGLEAMGNLREGDAYLAELNADRTVDGVRKGFIREGRIHFDHINFKYPGNSGNALKNVNLSIQPGENVIVIGKSGSGKSTILKLLMGFYEPSEGSVKIDGVDLREANRSYLRGHLKYLNQNVRLFNRPIIDNIVYGTGVDREQARKIVQGLKISKVLSSKNLDQMAGKFGDHLSGGQKQMVQLLRCYLDKSRLVLLDEPTSAIDPEHKQEVVKMIRQLMTTRQVIMVTHDWSLVDIFPRLVYMDGGRVVFDGPPSRFTRR